MTLVLLYYPCCHKLERKNTQGQWVTANLTLIGWGWVGIRRVGKGLGVKKVQTGTVWVGCGWRVLQYREKKRLIFLIIIKNY